MGQRSQIVSPLFCRYRTTMHWSVPGSSWCLVTTVQAAMWLLIRTWKRVKLRRLHCKYWWEGEKRMKDKEGWLKGRRRRERKGGERKEKEGGREGGTKAGEKKEKEIREVHFCHFQGSVSRAFVWFSLYGGLSDHVGWAAHPQETHGGPAVSMSVYIWVGKI